MADPIGEFLYVNCSAAEARRRVKGFGHGVRKVQSAGKNRAAIIHTAVGKHLDELDAQFADVGTGGKAEGKRQKAEGEDTAGDSTASVFNPEPPASVNSP